MGLVLSRLQSSAGGYIEVLRSLQVAVHQQDSARGESLLKTLPVEAELHVSSAINHTSPSDIFMMLHGCSVSVITLPELIRSTVCL